MRQQTVGPALRKARLTANLPQQEIAARLGISKAFLNDIESGRRPLPEEYYRALPEPLRDAVVDAAVRELMDRVRRLARIGKEPKDGGTGC